MNDIEPGNGMLAPGIMSFSACKAMSSCRWREAPTQVSLMDIESQRMRDQARTY